MERIRRIKGIGVHSGKMSVLHIYEYDKEGVFWKTKNGIFSYRDWQLKGYVGGTALILPDKSAFYGVEHFRSALVLSGITNVVFELEGKEMPILDGSAIMFFYAFEKLTHRKELKRITIKDTFIVEDENCFIKIYPSKDSLIKVKDKRYPFNPEFVATQILSARTYGDIGFYKYLKSHGKAKGSNLFNGLLISGDEYYNEYRWKDEPERHKILDFIGDVIPLYQWFYGRVEICRGGHSCFEKIRENNIFEKNYKTP